MLFKEEFCLFSKGRYTLVSWCYLKACSFPCLLTPLPHSLFLGITNKSLPTNYHPVLVQSGPQNRLDQTKSVKIAVTGGKNGYQNGIRVVFIFAQNAS